MHKILITGITGFLGSHIAEHLIKAGNSVIGLKRAESDIWRCEEFKNQIEWVDIQDGYDNLLINKKPEILIHCAWLGVDSESRDNWAEQTKNINFLVDLLGIAKAASIKKNIVLGSQAEYGILNNVISEEAPSIAANAYGSIKLASLEILKTYSESNGIEWAWLRVFSIFGEREASNWLIPSIIKKMERESEMDFTLGEQRYAYLYAQDFAEIVLRLISQPIRSGIYNISANNALPLKELIKAIRDLINPTFRLNFGALSYRPNQSMHVEGNISKLKSELGEVHFTNFSVALKNTVNYYINNKIL